MDQKVKRTARSQYYSFIVYPESAPENWIQLLESYHIQMLISPLHEPGKSGSEPGEPEGNELKPHHHVLTMFGSLKTADQVSKITQAVNGTLPFAVHSREGYARYLCHLDQKDKQQFKLDQVIELGGAVYIDNIGIPYNRDTILREMQSYVRVECIYSLGDFMDWCAEHNATWYRALTSDSAYIMKEYMQSKYWTMKNRIELQQMQAQARADNAAELLPFIDTQS